MFLNHPTNDDLMLLTESNSFGDQLILIVDISQSSTEEQRKQHPYVAGKIIEIFSNPEGEHETITEKSFGEYLYV